MTAFERDTPRLRLRLPSSRDLDAYVALHTDPRTYAHAPHTMPTPERCATRLDDDLAHWSEHGFGNLAAVDPDDGRVRGWAGVSLRPDGRLNLYYRLAHDDLGLGLGRELARAVVEAALEELPDRRVVAVVLPHHAASLATARAAGLDETGELVEHAGEPHVLLEAPHFEACPTLDDDQRREVVDLWMRVNDAGGAVGFLPGAGRTDVESTLARQSGPVGLLRTPDGALLGLGFWEPGDWWGQRHLVTLKRLMVDPARRRRGTGRLLMAGLHGLARTLPGVELWMLTYRSGLGVGDFYAGLGWQETGRVPLGIKLSDDDRRDSVLMMRRPDGGRLDVDGRR